MLIWELDLCCKYKPDIYHLTNEVKENSLMSCVRKTSNLMDSLEKSFKKSQKYEQRLLLCRKNHQHYHRCEEQWDSETSDSKERNNSTIDEEYKKQSSRSQVNVTESLSAINILCLRYQYEALSKQYKTLLQAYDERCSTLKCKEEALVRLRKNMNKVQVEVDNLHETVLFVGDKFLTLKCKKMEQKTFYKEKIETLKRVIVEILAIAEHARLQLDKQLSQRMATEHDTAVALLLAEIKKCNYLFLENLRLKTKVESTEG